MPRFPDCRDVVLVDGCRTPFLRSNSDFRDLTSYDLGRFALQGLLRRLSFDPALIDRVIMGTVISNLQTSNVARESMLAAGYPKRIPAFTVTQACISSNLAVTLGLDLIRSGQARVVVAAGTESMSDIPIRYRKKFRQKLIESQKYRKPSDYVSFLKGLRFDDVLPEIPSISEFSTQRTMGQDCDMLAARFAISRQDQDEFALRSHQWAAAAQKGPLLAEIQPVLVPPLFAPVREDNGVRGESSLEKLATLSPAFVKPYGTITAANASYLTDGASALLLMDRETADAQGLKPKALLRHYVYSAQDPDDELLLGPAYAISRLLDDVGLTLADIDVFELHEAFAAQVLANLHCLNSDLFAREKLGRDRAVGEIPIDKLNLWGGSLAIGHPFGATGARLVTTAANRLHAEDGTFALVAACAAGAQGHALLLERLN